MENNNGGSVGSVNVLFVTLLTLVFIALKLSGVIQWSWLWVLSPLWIDAIIAVVVFVFWIIIAVALERKWR